MTISELHVILIMVTGVVAVYMLSSLIVFIVSGKVHWVPGLTLAVGNGIGAYLGSNFAVARGDKWIRVILVITVLVMAAKLLGFTPF
ncbi:TSUP family transporter [Desulfoscipio geothermicus]|uniref:Probable membrane transporter protein n=1 Tax=Desulfoscipio geothermicus DSM 3669 TaxID=1121426 RepID=A0A1I6E7F9_9FIRM|nr:TSUP family transporter [Desulfoscipio geothermicus]SFR13673.1 Sulfite exporter TauE/SafE [Desulfoscipio geothermicus DSM 3669]